MSDDAEDSGGAQTRLYQELTEVGCQLKPAVEWQLDLRCKENASVGHPKAAESTTLHTQPARDRMGGPVCNVGWGSVGWDEMGWDGMGWDGMGWDGMGWDKTGWDGMWDTVRRDGMG